MNLFYIDITGGREWAAFRSGRHLTPSAVHDEDLCFVHLSEFLSLLDNVRDEIPLEEWKSLGVVRREVVRTKRLGRANAFIVFISGETEVLDTTRNIVCGALTKHSRSRIGFYPRVDRELTAVALEQLFGPLVDEVARGANSIQVCIDDVRRGHASKEESVVSQVAFRTLWQLYVLARSDRSQLPERLQRAKLHLKGAKFRKDYWTPVLDGGQLKESVRSSPDASLNKVLETFGRIADWDNVGISNDVVEAYLEAWVGALGGPGYQRTK